MALNFEPTASPKKQPAMSAAPQRSKPSRPSAQRAAAINVTITQKVRTTSTA